MVGEAGWGIFNGDVGCAAVLGIVGFDGFFKKSSSSSESPKSAFFFAFLPIVGNFGASTIGAGLGGSGFFVITGFFSSSSESSKSLFFFLAG